MFMSMLINKISEFSTSIEFNDKEQMVKIIENTLKMLSNRKLFDFNNIDTFLEKLNLSNHIFEVKLNNSTLCGIYILNNPITTIISGTPLDEYLSENINIKKLLIVKTVSNNSFKKVVKQLNHDYKNVEFFFDYDLDQDKASMDIIPKHQILTKNEIEKLGLENIALPVLELYDPMVRYYNGKVGDIFEIERPTDKSGYSIIYKKVNNGSYDIMFDN